MILIRFIADRSFVSRAIGWRTDGKPSHLEYLLTNDKGQPVTTFGARLRGGVRYRPYDYCKPTFEEWYTFPGIEESYVEAMKFNGRKYNWIDILYLLFGIFPKSFDPERLVCDQLVGYSNRRANALYGTPLLVNLNVPTEEMTPELVYACCTKMVTKVR